MTSSPLQQGRPPSRRALLVGAAALVAVAVALGGSFTGSHHNTADRQDGAASGSAQLVGATQQIAPDPAAAAATAKAEQAFSLALLQHLGHGTGNVSVSPESLALVLSMLENGAVGRTRSEIAAALHTSGLTASQQNSGWHGLLADLSAGARRDSVQLSSADSAWLQKGSTVRPAFLDALKSYYQAGVWTADFAGDMPAALAAIDSWTSDNTHGRITKLFDDLDPSTLLVLANAVYFKASWESPFDPNDTHDAEFTPSSGPAIRTPFLTGVQALPISVTKDYQAVQLPYTGNRFAALAVMPTHGSLADFTASLDADGLSHIVGSLVSQQAQVSLPKFTTRTTAPLNATLRAMGMPTAFSDAADFSAMTSTPVTVSKVIQRVYLRVAEKGTEAAASTGAAIASSAAAGPPLAITIDQPFLFLIRDTKTGAILFASQINSPSSG